MKQKIIHLTSSLKVGGAESLICDILRHTKEDFEHHVIYFHYGPNVDRIKSLQIKTYQIKGLICKYDPIFCMRLLLFLIKIKPDYILSHLWSANLLGSLFAKVLKIPIICVLHLASNVEAKSKNNYFRNSLDKITFKCATKLVAVSDAVNNDILKSSSVVKNKLMTIKNGIDYNNVVNQAVLNQQKREDFGLNDKDFVIGCVGRFVPRKRHELLIKSFVSISKNYPDIKLFLLGNGPLEFLLKSKVKELNIQDKIIFASSDVAYGFYPLFDIYVSTSQQEGLSIALLEAMSFGLPSIITNNSLNHEVISDNLNGFIIFDDFESNLQDIIKKLYFNAFLRQEVSKAAIVTVKEHFSFNKMINNYIQLLK